MENINYFENITPEQIDTLAKGLDFNDYKCQVLAENYIVLSQKSMTPISNKEDPIQTFSTTTTTLEISPFYVIEIITAENYESYKNGKLVDIGTPERYYALDEDLDALKPTLRAAILAAFPHLADSKDYQDALRTHDIEDLERVIQNETANIASFNAKIEQLEAGKKQSEDKINKARSQIMLLRAEIDLDEILSDARKLKQTPASPAEMQ